MQVEFCLHLRVGQLVHKVAGEHGSVEASYDVEIDRVGSFGEEAEVNAVVSAEFLVDVEQVHDDAVEYRAFADAVHAAQDVDAWLQVPADVLVPVPKGINLNACYVLSVHCLVLIKN